MRSVFVLVLLPLLAGCITEAGDEPNPIETEPEPEPMAESWGRRLFLLFPNPCPEDAVGNTTYNTSMESTFTHYCGKGIADANTTPPPCATFIIHDSEYRFYKGQKAAANITMEIGPGPVEVRLVWKDDNGTFAEYIVAEGVANTGYISIGRGYGRIAGDATVQRNSTTGLRFEIQSENFNCGKVAVGSNGSPASAIWVEQD